jgi:hypothetical protein
MPPRFLVPLGFRVEEFGSSGAAGSRRLFELLPYIPQREAKEEIHPRRKAEKGISPGKFPRDWPDRMIEPPPQDDDPNSSTLNPMSCPLPHPTVFRAKGALRSKTGGGQALERISKAEENFLESGRGNRYDNLK